MDMLIIYLHYEGGNQEVKILQRSMMRLWEYWNRRCQRIPFLFVCISVNILLVSFVGKYPIKQ